jgi:hypothetical protein
VKPPAWGRPVPANGVPELAGELPANAPPVSVIVVHYEQPHELARTLLALGRQRYDGELQVIVVDDGSAQPPDVPDGVQLVRQPRAGARRSAARNRGVAASRGQVLCFLDADTVPEPDYVAHLTRLPALAPEAVTVGRRRHAQLAHVALETPVATAGPANELPSPRWLQDGYASSRDLQDAGPRAFRFMISAVLSCSRWFYDQVGGFDESFNAYGGEDWEWAHRAWVRGAVFAHVPQAVAWHDGPDWSARHAEAGDGGTGRAEKNEESMRLSALISAAGHRPHGLIGRRAETLIEISADLGPAAAFVSVDSLLAALPHSVVLVDDALAVRFADDPRVLSPSERTSDRADWYALHVAVHGALTVTGQALADACQTMLDRDEAVREFGDQGGALMTITSARQRVRVARWGDRARDPVSRTHPDWLLRMDEPVDVEAYLGGWPR